MENKVLVKLIVPDIEQSFDVFVPINEVIWKVKKMFIKSICDITNLSLDINDNWLMLNKNTSRIYKSNEIIIDTDIRNGTELILITQLIN